MNRLRSSARFTLRIALLWLTLSALAAAEAPLTLTASWADRGGVVFLEVEGKAALPDGAMLDLSLELEGTPVRWAQAIVRGGSFQESIPHLDEGRPARYVVRARFIPDRQEDDALARHAPQSASQDLARGTEAEALGARTAAARVVDGWMARGRETLVAARKRSTDADPAAGIALALEGLDASARATCAVAWPYLPRSRGAIDRMRGWARGASAISGAEQASSFVDAGTRLLDEVDETLSAEREGRAPHSENAACERSGLADDLSKVVQAVQEETDPAKLDAFAPALARRGKEAVALLAPLLDTDPVVARGAAQCLGWTRCPEAREALVTRAAAGDPALRGEVLRSLARMGAPEASALVEPGLLHAHPLVRAAAVSAVLLLGGETRAPLLFPLCADPDAEVRDAARDAVRRLAGDWPANAPEEALVDRLRAWWQERAGRP